MASLLHSGMSDEMRNILQRAALLRSLQSSSQQRLLGKFDELSVAVDAASLTAQENREPRADAGRVLGDREAFQPRIPDNRPPVRLCQKLQKPVKDISLSETASENPV